MAATKEKMMGSLVYIVWLPGLSVCSIYAVLCLFTIGSSYIIARAGWIYIDVFSRATIKKRRRAAAAAEPITCLSRAWREQLHFQIYIPRYIASAGRRHVDFHFRWGKKGKKSDGRKFRRSGGGEKMKTSFMRTRPFWGIDISGYCYRTTLEIYLLISSRAMMIQSRAIAIWWTVQKRVRLDEKSSWLLLLLFFHNCVVAETAPLVVGSIYRTGAGKMKEESVGRIHTHLPKQI